MQQNTDKLKGLHQSQQHEDNGSSKLYAKGKHRLKYKSAQEMLHEPKIQLHSWSHGAKAAGDEYTADTHKELKEGVTCMIPTLSLPEKTSNGV